MKVDDEDGHYIVVPDSELTDKCTSSASLGLTEWLCTDQG